MVGCTKCRGPLRYDWQFPGMVCQMCGVVYYLQPNYELPKVGVCTVPRGGWHQSRAAEPPHAYSESKRIEKRSTGHANSKGIRTLHSDPGRC
jgi:hypothetical protein